MPRGGARPGAGRKPDPNSVRSKAKAKREALTVDGVKTAAAPDSWPFGTLPPSAAAPAPAPPPAPAPDLSELTPLDYLLEVMRDIGQDERTRIQAAQLAAPYVHSKPAPGGKKDAKNEAAKAVSGRFATTAPPRLVSSR